METAESKTSLGMPQNIEALLCYVFGFISGAVFLALEKENKFVRFHAMQSLCTFLPLFLLPMGISMTMPTMGFFVSLIVGPLNLILWLLLMFKAFQGQMFKLPVVGDIAEKQLNKASLPPPAS